MSKCIPVMLGFLACLTVFLMQSPGAAMAADPFKMDVLFVVDDEAVQKYKRMGGGDDIMPIMQSCALEISKILKSLNSYDFDVELGISDIIVLDKNLFTPAANKKVDVEGLRRFNQWLSEKQKWQKYKFDFAVMYTGFDMDVNGRAFRAGVCQPSVNSGIINFRGTYNHDAFVGAHEIAHILGAEHNTVKTCKGNGPFLLHRATLNGKEKLDYKVSPCSAAMIRKNYDSLTTAGKNCLTEARTTPVTGKRFGALVTPDEICQRTIGPQSSLTRSLFPGELHYRVTLCRHILCTVTKDTPGMKYVEKKKDKDIYYRPIHTAPGTVCGKDKLCNNGKCVYAEGSGGISNSCPQGNQPTVQGKTCADMSISQCAALRTTECCQSCGPASTQR